MLFLLKIFIYPLSILPLWLLRALLFPFKFLLKHVFKYREKVILKNLALAYPNESQKFYRKIQFDFYDNLFFLISESIKSFTISQKEAARRMKVLNPEILDKYAQRNQSAIMAFGHFSNWEWTPLACPSQIKHQIASIFQPLKNKAINDWILNNRSRTGVIMMSTKETNNFYKKNTLCIANAFIADQSPSKKGSGVWVDFFGRKTLFLVGMAVQAKKQNHPIVFIDIQRIEKGMYTISIEDLVPEPNSLSVKEIAQKFASRLEKQIKANPGNWLWSHNRWKHHFEEVKND